VKTLREENRFASFNKLIENYKNCKFNMVMFCGTQNFINSQINIESHLLDRLRASIILNHSIK